MNIELLNEIKESLSSGKSLSDIASELSMQKNAVALILRMDKILNFEHTREIDYLIAKHDELLEHTKLLQLENDTLKYPFVKTPFFLPDCSLYKNKNNILEEEINFLRSEYKELENSFSYIPMFIKKIFIKDEW